MTGSKPAIELVSASLAYRRPTLFKGKRLYWALRNISFSVPQGSTLGLVGRNGAGKSTLIRLLAGIYQPDEGGVHIHVDSVSLLALSLGFHPHLDASDNAILSGLLLGKSRRQMRARLAHIRHYSGLGDFFDRPLREYSPGMRTRLGFAVAVEANPDVLLIDEVLGVGDAEFREKSARAIRDRIKAGHTTLLVSHNPGAIKDLCDRVVWLDHGQVRQIGSPTEILAAYQRDAKRAIQKKSLSEQTDTVD